MKRVTPLALALALSALASAPGWAGPPAAVGDAAPVVDAGAARPSKAGILDRLKSAYRLLDEDRAKEALALLSALRDPVEDAGDADLLLALYDLTGYAGREAGDRAAEIGGNVQAVLLNDLISPLNAPDGVVATFTVAESFGRHGVREGQVYALVNVLAAVEGARRAGPLADDMEEAEAMASALLGQRLRKDERPEVALVFLRRAQALARKGRIDAGNATKLDALVDEVQAQLSARAGTVLPGPDACVGSPRLEPAGMAACRHAADRAFATGDVAGADAILSRLLADVPEGSLRAERYEAARDLLMVRQLSREAHDAGLLASTDLVANYLAGLGEVTAAALVGGRAARAAIDHGVHDVRIAQMCGHIARRAFRNGSPELARRMLSIQLKVLQIGMPEDEGRLSGLSPAHLERRLTAALVRLESAQIAAGSGLKGLAEAQRAEVDQQIATIDPGDFDTVESLTVVRLAGEKDYVFPTYTAALELVGRLARRLPAQDARHDAARFAWINGVEAIWGDSARADALADEAIREIRAAPEGRASALASLLMLRASVVEVSSPALSARFTREAYEVVAAQPGQESQRIDLLIDMASDQTDQGLARALIGEAQKLRETAAGISLPTRVRLDLKRSFLAFDDGDMALALRLGEDAVDSIIAAGKADTWMIVEPARKLAGLYAALGRMEDARRTYETHVFPQSDAVLVGDETALSDRLGLANLESYYAPDQKTVRTLSGLLDRARRRVKADRDLGRRILRAQAFAYHGLGDGVNARAAALEALSTPRPPASDTVSAREDRNLLETLVGADWLSSGTQVRP